MRLDCGVNRGETDKIGMKFWRFGAFSILWASIKTGQKNGHRGRHIPDDAVQ